MNDSNLEELLSTVAVLRDQVNNLNARLAERERLTPVEEDRKVSPVLNVYSIVSKPDKFDGTRKATHVKTFTGKMRDFIRCQTNLPPEDHVKVAASYLTKSAYVWFSKWAKQNPYAELEAFLTALELHFLPSNSAQEARDRLNALKQRSSVKEYVEKFLEILEEIDDAQDSELKTLFLRGLKKEVQIQARLADRGGFLSFDELQEVALDVDSILFQNGHFKPRNFGNGAAPMDLSNLDLEDQERYRREGR